MSSVPSQYLAAIQSLFPTVWRDLDAIQPSTVTPGCFARAQTLAKVIKAGTSPFDGGTVTLDFAFNNPQHVETYREFLLSGFSPNDEVVSCSADEIIAMASWRSTKLIYQFDADLLAELVQTPLTDELPTEIFERLPAHSFFLGFSKNELPAPLVAIAREEGIGDGIFVSVQPERIILCSPQSGTLSLDRKSKRALSSLVQARADSLCKAMEMASLNFDLKDEAEKKEARAMIRERADNANRNYTRFWGGITSALLYLCAQKPDMDELTLPTPKYTRLGNKVRTVAAKVETVSRVGIRVGTIFRQAKEDRQKEALSPGVGTAMPAHIRRAHWHTYWTGPRGDQSPVLRWLSPMLVNAQSAEDLDETIHPVERNRRSRTMTA